MANNKTVLITGSHNGIGLATAEVYLSNGYNVICHYHKNAPDLNLDILNLDIPILGVCYGFQLLLNKTGGIISKGEIGEYGNATIKKIGQNILFSNIPNKIIVLGITKKYLLFVMKI